MNENDSRDWLVLLAIITVLTIMIGFIVANAQKNIPADAIELCITECFEDETWGICNTTWLKNISYVSVYHNGKFQRTLLIVTGDTKEVGPYKVTSIGLKVYVYRLDP